MTPEETWDAPSQRAHCKCRCHRYVVIDDATGELKAAGGAAPRFDASLGWMEACGKCEEAHWLAASVHDEITKLKADGDENLAVYLVNQQRKQ